MLGTNKHTWALKKLGQVASQALLVGALAVMLGDSGEAAPARTPQTLIVATSEIDAFAQDGGDIAWITRGGRCGHRLHIRSATASRSVSIDGIACTDNPDQSELIDGELALAHGRVLWHLGHDFSNEEEGHEIRTASFADRRIRTLPCCRMFGGLSGEGALLPLAGSGAILVYYSHKDGEGGSERAVRRVVGTKTQKLFDVERPIDLAVDRGRIALVRRERPDQCGCNFKPVWSPDGTRIAFLRADGPAYDPYGGGSFSPQRPTEIAVMNADGSGLTTLTSDRRYRDALDWSMDGTKFVYAYGDAIAIANADGSESRDVANGAEPKWSPTGSAIVFESGGTVSVVNADGSGLRKLAVGEQPSWSPDGSRIAFIRGFDPVWVYVMRSDGTDVRKIAKDEYAAGPTWSPNGRRIAYQGNRGIYTVNADGSGRRQLTTDGRDFAPDWSPDGRRLVFSSFRDDLLSDEEFESELYLVNVAGGGGLRSLTAPGVAEWTSVGEVRSPSGAVLSSFRSRGEPDAVAVSGSLVAVLAHLREGSKRIALFDARSGAARGVVRVPRTTGSGLAASGRWVVFSVGTTIRAIDVRTRAILLLARTGGNHTIGLATSASRVAWAENPPGGGRIRVLPLPR